MSVSVLGQRVTWTVLKRDPRSTRGKLVHDYTRAGEVWSLGPTTETLWVIPDAPRDGEGPAVCVAVKGSTLVQRPVDTERGKASWQALELASRRVAVERSQDWHRRRYAS